ncbi:GIY-YIG nuclease family protein [Cecembia calidifontis]|uniref:Putative endonuclease n=1 Tax=Cecembia calidifontis TaxID=1187080 RepID=A0A4Q7PCG9_9BACT|nr:GIY-YIG nuclease family protein [Cecembia calidifontis]RZS97737.1 putative endonuclease [Cecembia calidifontis]
MIHFVYIIESEADGTFYIGVSSDPEKRLERHNLPHKGFTSRKRPWKLVYKEKFCDKSEALKRERFLKGQKSRQFLLSLINGSSAG